MMIVDFDAMMEMQRALQRKINGYDLEDQSDTLRVHNIMINVVALTSELHEALAETSWKPWAKGESFVRDDQFRAELIDAFHFMMNLFLHAGMTADDVWVGYAAKHGVNLKRQDDGYDGVSTKCPQCKRALDDPANVRNQVTNIPRPHMILYCVCGHELGRRDLEPGEV